VSTETSSITGVDAADPNHSSATFAVKDMGVNTFRWTFDRISAKLEGRPDGVALIGSPVVDSISIHSPDQLAELRRGAHPRATPERAEVARC